LAKASASSGLPKQNTTKSLARRSECFSSAADRAAQIYAWKKRIVFTGTLERAGIKISQPSKRCGWSFLQQASDDRLGLGA
jgi:hypothetical protein